MDENGYVHENRKQVQKMKLFHLLIFLKKWEMGLGDKKTAHQEGGAPFFEHFCRLEQLRFPACLAPAGGLLFLYQPVFFFLRICRVYTGLHLDLPFGTGFTLPYK